MDPARWHGPLKLVAWVILALMLLSLVYAATMAVQHWAGIGV